MYKYLKSLLKALHTLKCTQLEKSMMFGDPLSNLSFVPYTLRALEREQHVSFGIYFSHKNSET